MSRADLWSKRLANAATQRRTSGGWRQRPILDEATPTSTSPVTIISVWPKTPEWPRHRPRVRNASRRRQGLASGIRPSGDPRAARASPGRADGAPPRPAVLDRLHGQSRRAASLCDRHTRVFQDRLNHASLLDGARLAEAPSRRFHHRDLADLERLLERAPQDTPALVASDGVFSMDGDTADIAGLASTCQRQGAC